MLKLGRVSSYTRNVRERRVVLHDALRDEVLEAQEVVLLAYPVKVATAEGEGALACARVEERVSEGKVRYW